MGKVAQSSVKYVIDASLESSGKVEKPDIVGAIFGQTEGLLGEDLDLRELQERGRIGRIDVNVEENRKEASIKIPSSLDSTDTALVAAALETIERVGPTTASIEVNEIRDERVSKHDYIRKRAKQLLEDLDSQSPDHGSITQEVKQELRTTQITEYKGFEAGPRVEDSEEVVLVEGRADLKNLLKRGVKNCLALGGTSVPDKVSEVVDGKEVTAFLDGDRGGDLILEELREKSQVDYVVKAPENKEVEELSKEEIYSRLRDKEPVKYVEVKKTERKLSEEEREEFIQQLEDLIGTRATYVLDQELEVERRFPVNDFNFELEKAEDAYAVLLDGEVDGEKVEKAEEVNANFIAGMKRTDTVNSSQLRIFTKDQLQKTVKAS